MRGLSRLFSSALARRAFLALNAVGAVLITRASLAYFDEDDLHPFVLEKLPLPLEELWLGALHVHVVAAAIGFPGCLLLLSRTLLRHAPRLHRHLGRVTGAVLLFALVPSGAWLALFAKGGAPSAAGFLLSGLIVAVAMTRAILAARARDFAAHRHAIFHVVAQLSVAVTSRALLVGLDVTGVDPELSYLLALWLPVVGSAALAQTLAAPRARRHQGGWAHETDHLPRARRDPALEPRRVGGAALG